MYNMLYRKYENPPKGKTVGTTNLQPGEPIQMDFDFYNVTYICWFASMLTVVGEKNRMIWVLPTAST